MANNVVTFNGVMATVLTVTSTTLSVAVPASATSGPIAVTVGGVTATTASPYMVVSAPSVLAVNPQFAVSNSAATTIANFTVAGANLTGATFNFTPVFSPASITVNSAASSADGHSATLNLSVAAGVKGSFTLLATNAAGSSSPVATSSNTLQIIAPDDDADGDGVTNSVEIALGSSPLNAQTSGAGISDGWQVFYGLNPLSASSAGPDPAGSGDTALQDFQQGLSPVNKNRVPPAVAQMAPANAATGVPINSVVVVRFGEPLRTGTSLAAAQSAIAAALGTNTSVSAASRATAALTLQGYMNRTCCGNSVIPGTVVVSGPYGAITGGVTASSDGLSATFSPSVPMTSNTTYTVLVNGVRDAAGNLMTVPLTSTFTTGATVDSTPPKVTLVDPEAYSTGVPTNAHYTVQFSKAIDPGTLSASTFTIYDQTANANISGTIQVDASLTTASFIPDLPLPVGRTFTVTFTTGIKDTAGNPLASAVSYTFSTGYTPETAPQHFVVSSPVDGATGIPINAYIHLRFTQPLNLTTITPNITVSAGGQPVPVQMAVSSGDQTVSLTPVYGLLANATYTVTFGAGITNIAGVGLDNPGSVSFQTSGAVDKTMLAVTSWSPANSATGVPINAQMRTGFNKPVDVVSLGSANVILSTYSLGTGYPIAGTITPASDQLSVTFTPSAALTSGTLYCFSLVNVNDLEGNALSGQTSNCFTTGNVTQTAGPQVQSVSPMNGASSVPVNAVVAVGLNEAVSVPSVGQSAITLTAGGQSVAGTVTAPNAMTLQFTPASSLQVGTVYSVSVGGFTDLAGNTATAFSSSFTTGSSATPVKTGPTVVSVSPANGATAVAVTTPVVMTFSAAVNPLTVNAGTFQVYSATNGYVVAGSYAVNGAVVTFTPATPLPGSAMVRVYESGVQDVAGNTASASSTTFTTAATADITAPAVVVVTPSNGQTGVGFNGQVVVTFSKSMNPSTLTAANIALLAANIKQSFGITVSADNRTLTLSSLNLPGATVITLAISSGATDLSGNALPNFTSQFTTATAFDTTHATVVSQRPGNGATGVATSVSPVVLFVNKPLDASTVNPNTVQVTQNGQLVSGTLAVTGNGQTIAFTPAAAWTYGALVQVFLNATAQDTNGNTVAAYKGSFTVAGDPATSTPVLVNISPMSGAIGVPLNAVVDAQYSGALDPTTVVAANVYLYSGSKLIAAALTLDSTGTIIHLAPGTSLTASTQYCIYLYSLKGSNGTSVSGRGYCFTTGAASVTTAPRVTVVSPADKLADVPLNANISLTFSVPIDPVTVTGTTVLVSGGGMTAVPASISFSGNNTIAHITPEAPLPAATAMTVNVSGVTDVAGNAVTPFTSGFITGTSAATTNFGVVLTNPTTSATGVPVNAAISLQTNAEVDGTTVSTSAFQVYDTTLNRTVPGTYTLSADSKTVYFLPTAQLATGRTYQVNFYYGGMTDVAGNLLTNGCTGCLYNYSFTTGFTTSTTAPQVTGVSPAAGLGSVPLNAQIVVSFNEPVNPQSLSSITLTAKGNAVTLNGSLGSGNQLFTLTPAASLLPNTAYTLTITGVTDQSGNAMTAPVTSTFTTGSTVDLTSLTIVSVSPVNQATGVPRNTQVQVAFSKGINVVSLAGGNLLLYPYSVGTNYAVNGKLAVSADGRTVTFVPSASLLAETQYCIFVSGVIDLEGQNLSGSYYQGCFTTGVPTQTNGPSVITVSPSNGATGVPVNTTVGVGLSAAISAASVSQSAITLTAGSQAVAGVVTIPNSTTLLFTPASSLSTSTAYAVSVGGFTDLAGNPATAYSGSFTTGSSFSPVKTGPAVVSVSPASGATGVAVSSSIVMTFSGAINPLTVNASTFQVGASPNYSVLAGTYSVSGALVTFTPLNPLPGSSTIRIYESGVQDTAGNGASGSNTSFTTAADADTTAPAVVMVTPSNGQTGVGLNGQVVVVFSKSMNPSTLTASNVALLAGDAKQSFNIAISADNRVMTLSGLNLPGATVLTLVISSGVTDLSGNALPNFASQFTTAPAFDTTHATVVNQRPGNGATGVSTGASPLVLFLSKALDASTINGNTLQVTQDGQLVSGTLAVTGNGQTITFTPAAPWSNGSLVQIFLQATALDTSGNTVTAYKGSFTVIADPSTLTPTLVALSPMNGATGVPLNAVIHAQYSGALDPATVIPANVYLYGAGKTVTASLKLDATGTLINVTPSAALAANTTYSLALYSLKGANGSSVSYSSSSFTTGVALVTTGPPMAAVSPANSLTNVPLNTNIAVLFSAPIDPTTVTGSTVMVSGGGMTSVPASISFSNANQRVLITPQAPLPASTVMTLAISGVTDVAGNPVTSQTTKFTTGTGAVTSTLGVMLTNPLASATGVPVSAALSLKTNGEIDGTTVNSSTYRIYDQTLGVYIAGTYSLSADSSTMYFVPATQLATGRAYTVYFIGDGVNDVAGNALSYCSGCLSDYTFTTGFTTGGAPPQVTGISPANGLTKVPLNAQISVSFNEPVNAQSLGAITLSANGAAVGWTGVLSNGSQLLTVTPVAGLSPNISYTLAITGVADLSGNAMTSPVTSAFTTSSTADLTALSIVSVSPSSGSTGVPLNAQVMVAFSKGVNVVSLAGGNLILYPYSVGTANVVAGTVAISSDGTIATFTPTANLLAETQYCVYLSGVSDLEGQSLSSSSYQGCFTTGGAARSSSPNVTALSPANGATGVPVNALVEVALSSAISLASVPQSAITVMANGQTVRGTVTAPSASTLLWTQVANLTVSTAYTVNVSGFTDLAGNAVTAYTGSFTTGSSSTSDKTGPTIQSITPANGSTNVAVTTPIVVTFNEPVNPVTVTSTSVAVLANANRVAGTVTLNAAGTVATFTPSSSLPGGATINVYVGYYASVQDLAGNNAGASTSTSFTTATTTDTGAPSVAMVTPSNGQTNVGLNGQVVVMFSESMNPATLTSSNIALLAGNVKQGFNIAISADNRMVTLSSLNLPGSTVVTLAISSAVTDLSGNPLPDFTSQFTTASAFDTSHATVVSQRPGNAATGVLPTASPVSLFVNKPLDASTVTSSTVHVTQNGQLVSGTLTVVGNGQTIEFTPVSTWAYGALVQVFLDAAALDTSGNTVTAYKGSFTVSSDPAAATPTLINISPMSAATGVPLNASVGAQYSGALDPATVVVANVYLYSSATGRAVATTLSLDATGTIIRLTPSAALSANVSYSVSLYNLKGANGTAVSGRAYSFTTSAASVTTGPTVVTISPADKLANVPLNAGIGVAFSAAIDPLTVSGSSISLTGGGATSVPASISFSNNNRNVSIVPQAPLPPSTVMTVKVSGVNDVAGNPVTPFTSTFTTGTSAVTSSFGVLIASPAPSATGVPLNAAISLQTNNEVDGTTVSTASFQVYDNTISQTIAGAYSLSADGKTVYFVPAVPLAAGRMYSVNFYYGGMTDVAGNPMTNSCTGCLYNFQFTAGFAAGTGAPQVMGVSPKSGLTGVPINAQIVVAFNEPVNAQSLGNITLSANGSNVALNGSLGSGNQLLTMTPAAGLLPNTAYTLSVNGVSDLSGNAMTSATTSTFTTGGTVDLTALTITSFSPANGTASVPLNSLVRLNFSKQINLILLSGSNAFLYPYSIGPSYPIAGTLASSSDGKSVTLTPAANLIAETQYCVYVAGVIDLEGQSQSNSGGQGCFTTGARTSTTAPTVSLVSPADGATSVPVNAIVEMALSRTVSAPSVTQSAITVTANGQPIAGTVTVPNATTLLFTPAASLAVSTTYTVAAGGFTDLAGNAVSAFSSSFTTGSSSTPVKTGPTVVSVSPANSATGVAVNAPVVITFSALVNPVTVSASTFQVSTVASSGVLAGSYTVNGAVVTFTPLSPFPASSTIRVYESGVQDLAGNTVSGSSTAFTTATTADTTSPSVMMVTPSSGQTGVGLNGQVIVVFSESMNPSTLTTNNIALLAGGVRQNFSITYSADNRTLMLTNLNLPASTVVTLAISSGVADLSGNSLPSYTSQFTTASAFDTTHASAVSQRPGNGATGVLTSASPVVLFVNKVLDASSINSNTVQVTQNGQVVSGTLAVTGNGQTVTFTPASAWTYGALVQVFVLSSALDANGNAVTAYKGSFTVTGDPANAVPALVNISPMNSATAVPLNVVVDAQYSGAIDPASIVAANVYLYPYATGKAVAATVALDATGTIIHITPSSLLAAGTIHCYYLDGLKGANGTTVPNRNGCFTTGSTSANTGPKVTVVSPADKLTNVSLNANIAVLFSAPVDPITVNGSNIFVSGGGMMSVPASISFSNANQRVVITPQAPLPPSTVMTLTISGVTDLAGNAVTQSTTGFTTGTAPVTSNFGVTIENPSASASGVPINVSISLQTNAEVDGTVLNTSTFQVYDPTLSQTVAGSYSLSTDGKTAYFVPAAQLATGRTYQVNFYYNGMTDVAGNPLTNGCTGCLGNYTFTTGASTSTSAPQVTGISPSSSLTSVPINAQIMVTFDEPVNGQSLGGISLSTNGGAVPLNGVLSSGNQILTLTPATGLLANTAYTLTVNGVSDQSGNAMTTPVSSTFTTGGGPDLATAAVTAISPVNAATGVSKSTAIQVQFSKLMNMLTVTSQTVKLTASGTAQIPATLTLNANGNALTITPTSALSPSTPYSVQLTNSILDLEGGSLSNFQSTFVTGSN